MELEIFENNFLKIKSASELEKKQISIILNKKINNYKFHPLVKKKLWDGCINFLKGDLFPIGLWKYVWQNMKKYGYDVDISPIKYWVNNISYENFEKIINEFFEKKDIKPRQYQIEIAWKICKFKKSLNEIATSAGKTMIIFLVYLYWKLLGNNKKILIVVPNVSLILQTMENFYTYWGNKEISIKTLWSETEKSWNDEEIFIGTFQTLSKMPDEFFKQFEIVCIDEAHFGLAKSIKEILIKCINSQITFGLSGTLNFGDTADYLTLQSYIGPMISKLSARELIENNYATNVKIIQIYLDWLENDKKEKLSLLRIDGNKIWEIEQKLVISSQKRLEWIISYTKKLFGNTLILFKDVKNEYGKKIYSLLNSYFFGTNNKVFYIDGSTEIELREKYKKIIEEQENVFIVASTKVFGTGISINNLRNIVLVESYKSDKIIKQAIGRGMRLKQGKNLVNFIDIVDDFSYNEYENIMLKHGKTRLELYKTEKLDTEIHKIKI